MDSIKIEIGKRYVLRNGSITEPIQKDTHPNYIYTAKVQEIDRGKGDFSVMDWLKTGRYLTDSVENRFDIVAEYK